MLEQAKAIKIKLMKKYFFTICLFLCFLNSNSQTYLFGEYYAQYTSNVTPDNKNDKYKWIYEDGRYYMFFPQTPDGLSNLHDKVKLILNGSGLDMDEPQIVENTIPEQYQSLDDYNELSKLINMGTIRTHMRWNLNERQLGVTTSDDFYIIFVRNLN